MLLSKMVGERTKQNPADAVIRSHALMVRGGFIKQMSNGIYSLLPPAKRIVNKIENIIRQEMDAIDGQEVLLPVVMPKELWEESGRYDSIGSEMFRFSDNSGKGYVLGMTHEEAAVHLCRNTVSSYNQLPFMIYQIQTKERNEKRARGGLIRVKEFTMKDGYSFHMSQEDLEQYYSRCHHAYDRIFTRIGMTNYISVKSDSGMMGGSVAHEFMSLTPVGEDTLVLCDSCDYRSNMEVATCVMPTVSMLDDTPMAEVDTGSAKEIGEVCSTMGIEPWHTIKAVAFAVKDTDKVCLVFIRGDLEVNEAKVKKATGLDIAPCELGDSQLVAGNIGCVGLDVANTIVLFDASLEGRHGMVTGANREQYHISGVNMSRDVSVDKYVDLAKAVEGAVCPICGKGHIKLSNGIEIGNIFQLGTKYTKAMKMTVLDNNGRAVNPIMGCYGIGVGRAVASIAEQCADDKGIVWPMSIAPWQVELCPIKINSAEVRQASDSLYEKLISSGVEVLYDDRNASPGFKFADSELIGCPLRLVVSPRSIENNVVEVVSRDGTIKTEIAVDNVVQYVGQYIADAMQAIDTKVANLK